MLSNTARDPSLSENHVLYDICLFDACKKLHPPNQPEMLKFLQNNYSSTAMGLPAIPVLLELLLHLLAAKCSQIPEQFNFSFVSCAVSFQVPHSLPHSTQKVSRITALYRSKGLILRHCFCSKQDQLRANKISN